MLRFLSFSASVLLLGSTVAAGVSALSHAPAFNPALRAERALDGWMISGGAALYDPARYAVIASDRLLDAMAENGNPTRAVEAMEQAFVAVETAPADAYGWMAMAWSLFVLGGEDGARDAMRYSRLLAPYSDGLVDRRLLLSRQFDVLDAEEKAGVIRDLTTAHAWRKASEFRTLIGSETLFVTLAHEKDLN